MPKRTVSELLEDIAAVLLLFLLPFLILQQKIAEIREICTIRQDSKIEFIVLCKEDSLVLTGCLDR